ncbi:MAG: DUF1579 family protein [Phycisphaerales bacterium]|nr:DUF1579 family protein [Phycisphaerales bacterium]MCB9836078.1 DUF1579 family protein [Phycisphaera sp.]
MLCCNTSKFALTLAAGIAGGFMLQASLSPSAALQPESEAPSMEEMMAMMERLGQPGEHHEKLGRAVGDWNVEATFVDPSSGQEMKGAGSMSSEWVLDGRFVKTDFHMPDFMGSPFTGIGYNGYDNSSESYQGVWMDSMSTKVFVTAGELMDNGEFVWLGESAMGTKMKIVQSMPNDDTMIDTFFDSMDGGQSWIESGHMKYTRK